MMEEITEEVAAKISVQIKETVQVSSEALTDLLQSIEGLLNWRDALARESSVPLSWLLQLSCKVGRVEEEAFSCC